MLLYLHKKNQSTSFIFTKNLEYYAAILYKSVAIVNRHTAKVNMTNIEEIIFFYLTYIIPYFYFTFSCITFLFISFWLKDLEYIYFRIIKAFEYFDKYKYSTFRIRKFSLLLSKKLYT